MVKYHRNIPSVHREEGFVETAGKEPSWLKDFVDNLEKEAVKSRREDYSLFNEINSILGNKKSKYSTVQEAVDDMKKRTGLTTYLKQAQAQVQDDPQKQLQYFFSVVPNAKHYIENIIEARPGTSLASIVHDLTSKQDIKNKLLQLYGISDDVPVFLQDYITAMLASKDKNNLEKDKENPNIGKMDLSQSNDARDNDPLASCMPAKDFSGK